MVVDALHKVGAARSIVIDENNVILAGNGVTEAAGEAGPEGIVADWFLGSGSTVIAAEQEQRICRGVELDPVYCQVIIDRWEQFTGQKAEKVGELVAP